jgi:hypothetical protein
MNNQRTVRRTKAGPCTQGMRSGQRTDRHEAADASGPLPMMDISTALDLITAVVDRQGADFVDQPVWVEDHRYMTCLYAHHGALACIVGHVLAEAGVRPWELEAMGDDGIEDLYRAGTLPIALSIGALAVLRAAQRSQDRGCRWTDVLADANATAIRVLDLVPDAVFDLADDRPVAPSAQPTG